MIIEAASRERIGENSDPRLGGGRRVNSLQEALRARAREGLPRGSGMRE